MTSPLSKIESGLSSVIKNAGVGIVGQFVFVATRLASSIIITRTIGPDSFGVFVMAITVISFVEVLSLLGMENAIVKYVAQYRVLKDMPRLKGIFFSGLILVVAASILLALAVYGAAGVLAEQIFHKIELVPVLRVMAIALPFTTTMLVVIATLQGLKLIKCKVLIQRVQMPFIRLAGVVIAVMMGYELMGIVLVYVLVAVVGAMLACYYLYKNLRVIFQGGPVVAEVGKLTRFSTPLLFTSIFRRIIAGSDIIIMGFFLPTAMVGIYGVATRIIPIIIIPQTAVNMTFAPLISELHSDGKRDDLSRQFKTITKYVIMASLPIATLLILFSRQFMGLYGAGFVGGYAALIILCVGQLIDVSVGSVGFMLMMTGRPMANLVNSGLLCVISILLNIFLIPRYGIIGAAIANVTAISVLQVLRLLEVWYYLRIHPYSLDTLKPVLSGLLSALLLVAIIAFGVDGNNPFMLVIMILLYLLAYVSLLWLLGLSEGDVMLLNKMKRKIFKSRDVNA